MPERDRGMNWPNDNKNLPYKYLGSAITLALATAIFYLFGMIYLIAYFDRFSYTYLNLNTLPTIFVFPVLSIIALNIFILSILYELNNRELGTNYSNWTVLDELYKILQKKLTKFREGDGSERFGKAFVFLLFSYINLAFFGHYLSVYLLSNKFLLSVIYLVLMYYFLFKKLTFLSLKDINHIFLKLIGTKIQEVSGDYIQIFSLHLFLFILILMIFSNVSLLNMTADHCASNLVEGIQGSSEVKLHLNNDSSYNLPCDTFILVMQQDGCMYLVEKKKPAPEHSTLFVVPVTKIDYAAINLITDDIKPVSIKWMFYNLTNSTSNLFNSIKPHLNTSPKNNASLATKGNLRNKA